MSKVFDAEKESQFSDRLEGQFVPDLEESELSFYVPKYRNLVVQFSKSFINPSLLIL
jgi:hypothetical protein